MKREDILRVKHFIFTHWISTNLTHHLPHSKKLYFLHVCLNFPYKIGHIWHFLSHRKISQNSTYNLTPVSIPVNYALSGGVLRFVVCVAVLDPFCLLVGKFQHTIRISQTIGFIGNTESKTENTTQKCSKICALENGVILFVLFCFSL